MVCSEGFTRFLRRYNKTAALSSSLHCRKLNWKRESDTLVVHVHGSVAVRATISRKWQLVSKSLESACDTFKCSLSFVSTSSRINVGSCRPALAKSISNLGRVAENRTVWRASGRRLSISCICSLKPNSNNLRGRDVMFDPCVRRQNLSCPSKTYESATLDFQRCVLS